MTSIIKDIVDIEVSRWKTKALYRVNNEDWLEKSAAIALRILEVLRRGNITKEALSHRSGIPLDEIDIICKGHANLTLEVICKLESALNVQLIK